MKTKYTIPEVINREEALRNIALEQIRQGKKQVEKARIKASLASLITDIAAEDIEQAVQYRREARRFMFIAGVLCAFAIAAALAGMLG